LRGTGAGRVGPVGDCSGIIDAGPLCPRILDGARILDEGVTRIGRGMGHGFWTERGRESARLSDDLCAG